MSDAEDVTTEGEASCASIEEKKTDFEVKACTCKSVVVFLDRAEVCRSLKPSLSEGENEIFLTGLSSFLDEDSIRVEGKGDATIKEVTYQTRVLTPQEQSQNKTKVDELNKLLKDLRKKENVLNTKLTRFKKQREVLDNFADTVSKTGDQKKVNSIQAGGDINPESLQWVQGFFDVFDTKAESLDDAIFAVEQEMEDLRGEIDAQTQNLYKLQSDFHGNEARVLSILLEATSEGEVELSVSYVVNNASWSPKYDIRVFSDDKTLKVQYYGVIRQATGEDWEDTKLSLSTAMPSVGGTVPELTTVKVGFKPKIVPYYGAVNRSVRMKKSMGGASNAMMSPPALAAGAFSADMDLLSEQSLPMMAQTTAEVRESVTSAVFEIARLSSIPADNTDHKVSVALIDLAPDFQYQCVPKLSTFAYLTAKVKNTSQYALLAGPSNIFLDNNFVAKASLKAVSPGEEFECSLGIDQSIKVTYKPVHKFHEKSGLWSKVHTTTYKQVIELHNKHRDQVNILVTDQLPQSMEEKVKVSLLEPVIKANEKTPQNVKVNQHNNVEWTLVIAGGMQKALVLRYSIEHPVGEETNFTEVSNTQN